MSVCRTFIRIRTRMGGCGGRTASIFKLSIIDESDSCHSVSNVPCHGVSTQLQAIIIIIIIMGTKHRYEHVPKSVETTQGGKVTILWNQQVRTDRTILTNKTDIIMRDNEKRTCILIDVAISGDSNDIRKEAEQMLK